MADKAHEWTDGQIEELEHRFERTYSQAAREMREKLDLYLSQYEEANAHWKDMLRGGEVTDKQYREWLKAQSVRRDYLVDMCDTLAHDATRTNQLAFAMINDELPRIYAENANYAAYGIESHLHANTHAFDLVDQSTVRRMMGLDDEGQIMKEVVLLPEDVSPPLRTLRKVNVNEAKDVRWNRQKFNAAITQSILQGESIPNTAKRLSKVLNMGKNMAVRAARTSITSAENAGRVDSYLRAKRIGIELEQEWLATLDERTRYSHRELDGQHVPVGEKFKVPSSGHELEFPADPTADPSEVWGCRCTLVAWFPEDGEESAANRFSRLPEGMTYEQWKSAKQDERNQEIINDGNPPELAGVRRGRPMTFDEANELRGNPDYNIAEDARRRYYEINRERDNLIRLAAFKPEEYSQEEFQRLTAELEEARRAYDVARREQNGYRINCQTCVVANEARRRGYNVEATPNIAGSANDRLSRNTSLAWIDRATGLHPTYIRYDGSGREDALGRPIPTRRTYTEWLFKEGTIEEGARYTIEFEWSGRGHGGHVVCLERTEDGLRLYDPQCGETYDEAGIRDYLGRVKYRRSSYGHQYAFGPDILKVSDFDFDIDMCNQILREAR